MTFDEAFDRLIGHEGGYVNDPNDPGGETKYGISKRQYPSLDIRNLTIAQAKTIYLRDYWRAAGCEAVLGPVRFDLFDTAVNAGVRTAVVFLQKSLDVKADGILGPITQLAARSADPEGLHARFNGHRLDHLNNLSTWPHFGRGWAQRIADNLMKGTI